jgi:hypothetical protein
MVDMGDKKVKTVKVPEAQAEKWENYADETPEVDSVSHLIRLSVQKEISGEYDVEKRRGGGSDGESAGASGEILTHLRQIQTAIGDVEERVSALEETESAEASYSLQKAIYAVLSESRAPKGMAEEDYRTHDDVLSARELAQKLDADVGEVDDTLERMDSDSDLINVEKAESGQIYAWRVPK